MDTKSQDDQGLIKDLDNQGIVVHSIRVAAKVGIALTLYFTNNVYALPLTAYLLFSEILDQISLYLLKKSPEIKNLVGIFYVINSVTVISSISYFAGWSLTDFYLIYIIHISSSTLAYGFKNGLISSFLSVISYSFILYINQAPALTYLRLPLISLIVIRLLVNQLKFEKTHNLLDSVLGIEKSKQDFIALASHNLRTPVAAIYGYIDILFRGDAGILTREQSDFLQKIRNNNQELEKITEQLLEISILEVGRKSNLLKQPGQLEIVIEDVVSSCEARARAKGIDLIFQKNVNLLPMVSVDIDKIRAVLFNLVDNSIKYTEKGSVVIKANADKNFLTISVQDTGIGISEKELPKVFNKFYRSGNILVYNQTGVGLGLYLGKKIIELHGGEMGIKSTEGKGTILFFKLPIAKEDLLE